LPLQQLEQSLCANIKVVGNISTEWIQYGGTQPVSTAVRSGATRSVLQALVQHRLLSYSIKGAKYKQISSVDMLLF
jgi:hypothetical protein